MSNTRSSPLDKPHILLWMTAISGTSETSNAPNARPRDRPPRDYYNTSTDPKSTVRRNFLFDNTRLENILVDMHSSLSTSGFRKYREYRRCPSNTVEEVYNTLRLPIEDFQEDSQGRDRERWQSAEPYGDGINRTENDSEASDNAVASRPRRKRSSTRYKRRSSSRSPSPLSVHSKASQQKKFVQISKTLFQLFLPLTRTSEMVFKYWGAVNALLQVRGLRKSDD